MWAGTRPAAGRAPVQAEWLAISLSAYEVGHVGAALEEVRPEILGNAHLDSHMHQTRAAVSDLANVIESWHTPGERKGRRTKA